MRIDSREHANKITDEQIVDLRRASIVVADLTGQSPLAFFGAGLALARLVVHRAVGVQSDVAVRVDQAGDDPALGGEGVGAGDRLWVQDAVGDPEVDDLVAGKQMTANVKGAAHGASLPTRAQPPAAASASASRRCVSVLVGA